MDTKFLKLESEECQDGIIQVIASYTEERIIQVARHYVARNYYWKLHGSKPEYSEPLKEYINQLEKMSDEDLFNFSIDDIFDMTINYIKEEEKDIESISCYDYRRYKISKTKEKIMFGFYDYIDYGEIKSDAETMSEDDYAKKYDVSNEVELYWTL